MYKSALFPLQGVEPPGYVHQLDAFLFGGACNYHFQQLQLPGSIVHLKLRGLFEHSLLVPLLPTLPRLESLQLVGDPLCIDVASTSLR